MTKEAYLISLVPRMYKTEFDDKASDILAEFCPDALETPMAVPIEQIATENLHLTIRILSLGRSQHTWSDVFH